MRHIFLRATFCFCILAAGSHAVQGQAFSEDFDGIGGSTAGGAGTYSYPAGWLKFNVDNRTPATAVSYVNEAWERREDFANNVADSAIFSTSWYSPAGAADDWTWTPAIACPSNAVLNWNAITYDPSYPDGYQVRIKTGAAPTQANQATSATLFSIVAENTTWTARTQSLSAYAGQTIYVGFRNNSTDEFLLLIDDVVVVQQLNQDAQMQSVGALSEYTILPISQAFTLPLTGVVRNNGLQNLSNVFMRVNVFDGTNTQVYTTTSNTTATLTPGSTANCTAVGYTPTAPDFYTVEYIATHSLADQAPVNDTLYQTIIFDDSTFARDNGTVTGSLGIGGGGGILGQMFQLTATDDLTSVLFYITNASHVMDNQEVYAEVWAYNNGAPTTLLARTDTAVCDTAVGQTITLAMSGGPLTLPADSFWVGVVELDSNITLGTASSIFTAGTTNVDFPYGTGTWNNNEFYGFNVSYVLRANFGIICPAYVTNMSHNDANCGAADGDATVNVTGGPGPFTYLWDDALAQTTQTAVNLAAGTYSVTVTDANGCTTTGSATVNNLNGPSISSLNTTPALCNGGNGTATVTATGGTPGYTYLWSNGGTTATITEAAGTYTVTVTDSNGCLTTGSGTITEPTAISVGVSNTPDTGAGDGTATANPSGGTGPYTYAWSTTPTQTTQTATNLGAGSYTVTVTDANGCTSTGTTSVATGVDGAGQIVALDVFPNPSHGVFTLSVSMPSAAALTIEVMDMAGKVVYTYTSDAVTTLVHEVNLGEVAAGSYLLKVSNGTLNKVRRISVQ